MYYIICFFLFMFGAFPGLLYGIYGNANYIIIPWFVICLLLFFTYFLSEFLKQQKFRETRTYQELDNYIASILESHKELYSVVKNVKLVIASDSDCKYDFNGQACMFNRIKITHSWFIAATMSQDAMEYLKCTICHELSHLYSIRVNKASYFSALGFFIILNMKSKIVKHSTIQWQEEFFADYMGCLLYGNKKTFLDKMKFMNELFPSKNKPSSHPSWALRISFIENSIEPTYENVERVCLDYYKSIGFINK